MGNGCKAIGINLHTPYGTCQVKNKKSLKRAESKKNKREKSSENYQSLEINQ